MYACMQSKQHNVQKSDTSVFLDIFRKFQGAKFCLSVKILNHNLNLSIGHYMCTER